MGVEAIVHAELEDLRKSPKTELNRFFCDMLERKTISIITQTKVYSTVASVLKLGFGRLELRG